MWDQQAPFAWQSRTLTRGSALAFARYCRIVVLERRLARSKRERGGPNHRGVLKQLNAYEVQFLLSPCKCPMPDAFVQATETPTGTEGKLTKFRT